MRAPALRRVASGRVVSCPAAVAMAFLLLMAGWVAPVWAQESGREPHQVIILEGHVRDNVTGEALPGATVQVEGTYTGTVTNRDGAFALATKSLPVILEIRFIGYVTERVEVAPAAAERLEVRLRPTSVVMPELVVSAEDPAIGIMRKVIRRKAEQKELLESYAVDAYNRFRIENDTGIVSIWESFTKAWWHREKGIREVSLWQEQTRNALLDDALPAAIFVVNLSDDDIDVAGHRLMGVTHPRAVSMYDFRLDTLRAIDDQLVYDIRVAPRSDRGSGFVGKISILDEEWVMIRAELSPGESFLFPPPIKQIDVTYEQQFSRFSGDYWLPAYLASDVDVKIELGIMLSFPEIRVRQFSRLSDFRINVPVPDSLYSSEDLIVVDTARVESVRPAALVAIPLTPGEERAYATLDSTVTMEDAFAPGGLLGRLSRLGGDGGGAGRDDAGSRRLSEGGVLSAASVRPAMWYNRVEGLHSGAEVVLSLPRTVRLAAQAGYNGASRDWTRGAWIEAGRKVVWHAAVFDDVDMRIQSRLKSRVLNSLTVLAGEPDYFDYVSRRGVEAGFRAANFRADKLRDWWVEAGVNHTDYASEPVRVTDTFLGTDVEQVQNAAIQPGTLTRARVSAGRNLEFIPFGLGASRRVEFDLEVGLGGSMPGSGSYVRAETEMYWRFATFNRRRLLPQALDVRLLAGVMSSTTPLVRHGLIDGSSRFTEFGALRTREDRPYEGTRYGLLAWEHTLRTIPFEMLGWGWAVERNWNVVVHGAHGASWAPRAAGRSGQVLAGTTVPSGVHALDTHTPGYGHHEIGASLSGILTLFRLDAAWRLDEQAFRLGASISRIF